MSVLSPLPAGAFDPYAAAHLLWRAGFGGTWDQAVALAEKGLDGAVEGLVSYTPSTGLAMPETARLPEEGRNAFEQRLRTLDEEERNAARRERTRQDEAQITGLKIWWLRRMLATDPADPQAPPLEEKLTLFWHGHFASGYPDKIKTTFPLWQQNQNFRAQASGALPDQLKSLIRDPAMLVWLDNASSNRGNPNENFARELMELFTTGVGQYTEQDVKEGARALTGYGVDRDNWTFQFRKNQHDPDEKTFLGRTGPLDGDDVVATLCAQPATANFLAKKLLRYFVCTQPDESSIKEVAAVYRDNGYQLRELLGILFRSEYFYSEKSRSAVVKSPVALAIGALKSMRTQLPPDDLTENALRVMGQDLFFPPDVNGWPGGGDWINSNTLLVRYNFANFLMHGVSPDQFKVFDRLKRDRSVHRREFMEAQRNPDVVEWDPRAHLVESGEIRAMLTSTEIVDYYLREFLQRPPSRELRDALNQLARTDGAGGSRSMSVRDRNFDERARGLVHLIMSSPEYQLS